MAKIHKIPIRVYPRNCLSRVGSGGRMQNLTPRFPPLFLSSLAEGSPLLNELNIQDVNSLSPIEALNKLFEWQKKYGKP